MVLAGVNSDAPNNIERAMVVQKFDWEDQIQAFNLNDNRTANLALIKETKVADQAEENMMDLQHGFMVFTTPEPNEVSETSCTPSCITKYKLCREQVDSLIREIEDIKYDGYVLRKGQNPLKEKLEAQTKDYKRIQEELSVKSCLYDIAQQKIITLTAELDVSNSRFRDAEFNFKKFEVSSEKVEVMIEKHLQVRTSPLRDLDIIMCHHLLMTIILHLLNP